MERRIRYTIEHKLKKESAIQTLLQRLFMRFIYLNAVDMIYPIAL